MTRLPTELRSQNWYGGEGVRGFSHRARTRQMGIAAIEHENKPVIGIINTWSEINPCHLHLRDRAEAVKRGVWQQGGYPIELPASAIGGETFSKPTAMLYRNLLAMETEELIRSYPVDGVVLMGGCDKTTPALLMGAISAGLPAIFVPAGPMLRGNWRGEVLGSGSDMWRYWDDRRAGLVDDQQWSELEEGIARSPGFCMTMGTASTMTAAAEVLGMSLPGASSIPAADSAHTRMAVLSGRTAVDMVWADRRPAWILTEQAFQDAVTVAVAMCGSTNAVIHLVAMARRAGIPLSIDDFDATARRTPVLANIRPMGAYLMEDFYYAGGLRALMAQLADVLHLDRPNVTGDPMRVAVTGATTYRDDVIRSRDNPVANEGGIAVLRGNLCPDGAVIKSLAADPALLIHTGPAVVFDGYADLLDRIDSPLLDIDENTVLVLRGAGPLGGPGMPEHGMLPIPQRLLARGVRDLVRVSDARMSGTSYGACVLHVAPESHVGGPLALVHDGDLITLDTPARQLTLHLSDDDMATRRAAWIPPPPHYARGYGALHAAHITQANEGCDFDFLATTAETKDPDAR